MLSEVFTQLLPLQRECLVLRGQDPNSSWTSDRREGWDGARPCPQMPSGDLGPAPVQRVGEPGERLGVRRAGRKEAFLGDLALSLFS